MAIAIRLLGQKVADTANSRELQFLNVKTKHASKLLLNASILEALFFCSTLSFTSGIIALKNYFEHLLHLEKNQTRPCKILRYCGFSVKQGLAILLKHSF